MEHRSSGSLLIVALALFLTSCGSGSNPAPPAVSVSVSPASVNLIAGAGQQFAATVHNSPNPAVTWAVAGTGCSGAACGSVSSSGFYTAPSPVPAAIAVTLTLTSGPVTTPLHFAYFIVSATEAYVIEIDPRGTTVPTLSGTLLKQSGAPYTKASLSSPAVLDLTGVASYPGSHVIVGQAVFDGNGNLRGISDENNSGTPATAAGFTGTYSVTGWGRGTANLLIGGGSTAFTFYMVSPGKAFLVAGSPESPIGEVMVGTMEPQTGAPFSTTSIAGTYAVGSLPPSLNVVPGVLASITLASSGSFTGMFDACTFVGCTLSESGNATLTFADTSAGRGTVDLGSLAGPSVFYTVSPKKLLLLDSVMANDNGATVWVVEQ